MSFLCRIKFVFLFFLIANLEAKVNIFAHYFGQPEFIKYQHLFFQKNMLDEYEFVVFEDSNDPAVSEQIKAECEKYGIHYIHIPESVFEHPKLPVRSFYVDPNSPSFSCAVATQYIYDHFVVPSEDICVILDNDIFLLSPFSIEEYLGTNAFAYKKEERGRGFNYVDYMLPNFLIFNPCLMPEKEYLDFNLDTILGNNTDSGGCTYFYLRTYSSLGRSIPTLYTFSTPSPLKEQFLSLCPLLFTSQEWSSHYFIDKEVFLHLRMGSNWSKHPNYLQIKQEIETFFTILLEQTNRDKLLDCQK